MNTGYTIYQVERIKSAAEQREVDRSNVQLAAAISRLWGALAAPWPTLTLPWRARRTARRHPVRVTAPRVSAETLSHAAMRYGPDACPAVPDGRVGAHQ
jgi:hypothetical protein